MSSSKEFRVEMGESIGIVVCSFDSIMRIHLDLTTGQYKLDTVTELHGTHIVLS